MACEVNNKESVQNFDTTHVDIDIYLFLRIEKML